MSTRDACPAPCVVADRCPLAALIRQLHSAVSGSNLPPVPCGPIPADRRIGPPLPVSGVVDPEDNPVTTSHLSKPASTTAPPELPPAETLSTRAEFDAPSADPAALTVVRSRHPWRWVAAIAVAGRRRAVHQRAGHQPRLGLADVRPVLHRAGRAAGAVADHPAHGVRNGARLRPRHRVGRRQVVEESRPADGVLDLCVGVPLHPADRPAAVLVQHRLPVPDPFHRHPFRADLLHLRRQFRDQRDGGGGDRLGPAPGRLFGGDHPGRHPVGRPGPAGSRCGAGHPETSAVLQDRPAAGDAGHPAERGQRGDQPCSKARRSSRPWPSPNSSTRCR